MAGGLVEGNAKVTFARLYKKQSVLVLLGFLGGCGQNLFRIYPQPVAGGECLNQRHGEAGRSN